MAEPEDFVDENMEDIEMQERHYGGESSGSASSSLLGQWNRSSLDAEDTERVGHQRDLKRLGPSYLVCLTIGTGGLQVIWTAIMGQGSPYLSSLGLPPYVISFIWLAGPLSGALVQPYVSILSDRSRHPWGRRKPYIIYGTIATVSCMLLLPWSGDFICSLFSLDDGQETAALTLRGIVAASLIWGLNVAIQPVQMGIRALIVDACPLDQQVQASAYASCITGVGSILGYASGFVKLPRLFPWFLDTQFKCLCVIASVALGSTVTLTCSTIKERKVIFDDDGIVKSVGVLGVFKQVIRSVKMMSSKMRRICAVQFFSWLGWFPFLFYITTYIGSLYKMELLSRSTNQISMQFLSMVQKDSIRHGTLAMVLFAIIALVSNLVLPLLISSSSESSPRLYKLSNISTTSSKAMMIPNEKASFGTSSSESARDIEPPRNSKLNILLAPSWLTLSLAWSASQVFSAMVLLSTSFTKSPITSTLLVSLLGISWALTQWAPLALISAETAKQEVISLAPLAPKPFYSLNDRSCSDRRLEVPTATYNDYDSDEEKDKEEEDPVVIMSGGLHAGAVMGVYNVAIATPQIVAAVGSSVLFWLLGRWGLGEGEVVGWVISIGGLSGFAAAWLALGIDSSRPSSAE